MNDNEIELLQEALKEGLYLVWICGGEFNKVKTISTRWDEDRVGENCEGFLCASFSDGKYVALYNCEFKDFAVTIDVNSALNVLRMADKIKA